VVIRRVVVRRKHLHTVTEKKQSAEQNSSTGDDVANLSANDDERNSSTGDVAKDYAIQNPETDPPEKEAKNIGSTKKDHPKKKAAKKRLKKNKEWNLLMLLLF